MSQQFSSRYPADVVEHGKFGTHLALLMPPLAALLYPFLLEAFHANISPVIRGQSAEPALRSAVAASLLLLAFIAPIVALLGAMRLGELAAPSVAQRRARAIALLAVAAPPLFVFLGVELYMLHDPVSDIWVWVIFWLVMTALAGFARNETPAPPPADAAPARLRVAHGISALGIIAIFLALHLANHLTFILGPDAYRAVMKAMRHVYRQEFLQPLLVGTVPVSGRQWCLPRHAREWPPDGPFPNLSDCQRHFPGGLRARTHEFGVRVCTALSRHRQRLGLRRRRAVRPG